MPENTNIETSELTAEEILEQIEASSSLDEVKQYIKAKGDFDESAQKAFEVLDLKLGVAGPLPESYPKDLEKFLKERE